MRRAFTIVELLVTITIIAVLISILVPAISKIRAMANGIKCEVNVRSLTHGVLEFAADHDGCLPGALYFYENPNASAPYQRDWLLGCTSTGNLGYTTAPQGGTLWPYIQNTSTYLCPSMSTDVGNLGYVSNGYFDYGFFVIFNGAPIRKIPVQSQMILLNGGTGWYPTPIICQEEAVTVNDHDIEGDHSNNDQISHLHNGGSWYGSIDGSVNFIIEPEISTAEVISGCWQWSAMAPETHAMHTLGAVSVPGVGQISYWSWGTWLIQ